MSGSKIKTYWYGFFCSIVFYVILAVIISGSEPNGSIYRNEAGNFTGFVNYENDTVFYVFIFISILIIFILVKLNSVKKSPAIAQLPPDKKDNFYPAENLLMRDMHGRPFNEKQDKFSILERLFLNDKEPWDYTRKDSISMLQFILADAVAIFGFVLFLLSGNSSHLMLFTVSAIAGMILAYPRKQ